MLTRTMMLALAVGSLAAGCVGGEYGDEMTGAAEGASSSGWDCDKSINVLSCNGFVNLLPTSIKVEDNNVNVLNDLHVEAVKDSLNGMTILSGISIDGILNKSELTVIDALNGLDLDLNIDKNKVWACVLPVLSSWVCK